MWGSAKFNPVHRHRLLFASFMARGGERSGSYRWTGVLVTLCSPHQASLYLVIWRQAEIAWPHSSATVYSMSLGRGRGHETVFTSSLTSCGWSPFAEIQWLHQTLLTHRLPCLIGKAIKHESSRAPRLRMMYFEFSGSSQITLHLFVLC